MSVRLFIIIFCLLLSTTGCGSSSEPDGNETPAPETPAPETPVPETPVEPVIHDISCEGQARLVFSDASSVEETSIYKGANAIDARFFKESRWSTNVIDDALLLEIDGVSLVKGIAITWLNEDMRSYTYDIEVSKDKVSWVSVISEKLTDMLSDRSEYIALPETTVKYIKIIPKGNNINNNAEIIEVEAFGCQTDITSGISLDDWYLSIPVDTSIKETALSIYEEQLNDNYFNAEFYFASLDNGLVFRAPIEGAKTSVNTSYTRTELREMLRAGNTSIKTQGVNENNWVFSSTSQSAQNDAGGVDGELFAELAVNHVTTTGDDAQLGRVIIGQIHANDDEPIRVYYRKLPNNDKGAVYLAHEPIGEDDIYRELIGSKSKSADNPENGIQLNERFSYKISVTGNQLTLTIIREGYDDVIEIVDMSDSGYDDDNQYMYFKAGVYNQNKTGDPKDYVQATFYKIENSHD